MKHKLGICIPYRNRKEHLEKLVPQLGKYLTERGIDHKFYVGHQVDDKLFNRGAMKNVAAEFAFNDGCDYIAWHDVDMVPYYETSDAPPDYSYPEEGPVHIATRLSKYAWSMGYEQYFGGVVLFTKEHVEKTNGYSNDYWDWGQEDDDLFYRCHYEGYSDISIVETLKNKDVGVFNGKSSFLNIPMDRMISGCLHRNHTISVLVNSFQQPELVPIWLVGDKERKFMEYPILRKEGAWTWGLSFNNSRAYNVLYFDKDNNGLYHWAKRNEDQWTRFTISYNEENDELYVYMNDQLVSNNGDILRDRPIYLPGKLKLLDSFGPFVMGRCPQTNNFFSGKISELKVYDTYYKSVQDLNDRDLVYQYDFSNTDGVGANDVEFIKEDIEVIRNVLPVRRHGSFTCLPHQDEGFVNGTWAKGDTTARNERRFVTEMQQKKIDYKNDGMNTLKYNLVNTEMFMDNCLMINVTL
jgi:hypothetical protein